MNSLSRHFRIVICAAMALAGGQRPGAAEVPLRLNQTVKLQGQPATVVQLDAVPLVESEYTRRFKFERFENPRLKQLRERYALDVVIASGEDEFDRQVLLLDWVHNQFRKFGTPSTRARDALEILSAIDDGHTFFCTQYAEVLVSAAASLGWVNRPLALRRHQGVAKVGGSTEHSVTEIWSNQHCKWIMLDPTSNMYVEMDGLPLNAFEIRQEWFYKQGTNLTFIVGKDRRKFGKTALPIFLRHFPGFGDLAIHPDELDKYGFIGYIPNTDLMTSGFDYAGMFIVKDQLCEGTKWHTRIVPRDPAVDPYFPMGQAALNLVEANGRIRVLLQTFTPNLDRYEIRSDGTNWKSSGDQFFWDIQPGVNRLEARTVNKFGVTGPISIAEITTEQ